MVCGNPAFDQLEEILCLRDNLFGLRMGCDGSMIVVDYIAPAAAGLEKIKRLVRRRLKRQAGDLKGQAVMARVLARRNPAQAMDIAAVCKAAL